MRFRCGQYEDGGYCENASVRYNGARCFRYYATIDYGFITPEMVVWCSSNFKKERYWHSVYSFYFTNEEDRNWFILRWS